MRMALDKVDCVNVDVQQCLNWGPCTTQPVECPQYCVLKYAMPATQMFAEEGFVQTTATDLCFDVGFPHPPTRPVKVDYILRIRAAAAATRLYTHMIPADARCKHLTVRTHGLIEPFHLTPAARRVVAPMAVVS